MTTPEDPPRLFDNASGLSDRQRSVLDVGRSCDPSDEQLQRLESRLAPLLAPAAGLALGGGAAAGKAVKAGSLGVSAALKWLVGGAALGGAVAVSAVAIDDHTSAPTEAMGQVVQTASPFAARAARSAENSAPAAEEAPAVAPTTDEPAQAPPVARPSAVKAAAGENSREAEVALLGKAQRALQSGQPAKAIALTEEHRKMPKTVLSQERERIAIEALLNLGQRARARSRADAFRRHYPKSSYLPRIDSLFGGKEKNDANLHK